MTWVISLIEGVRSARAQMRVPASLQVPLLVSGLDETGRRAWEANEALITRLARIETLDETGSFPKGTVTIPVGSATFGLPLEGLIDPAEEIARLEKQKAKLSKEIGGLEGRLKNPKFVESAPDEVVEEARENLAARQEEMTAIDAALDRLRELG